MKLWLPFNLISELLGTGIAGSFGLRYDEARNQTLVEGPDRQVTDLLDLLVAFKDELEQRELRLSKRDTNSPLGVARKSEVGRQLAVVAESVRLLREQLERHEPGEARR